MKFICPECGANLYVAYRCTRVDRFRVNPETGTSEIVPFDTEDEGDGYIEVHCLGPRRHNLTIYFDVEYLGKPDAEYRIESVYEEDDEEKTDD